MRRCGVSSGITATVVAAVLALRAAPDPQTPLSTWEIVVLGVAQDGGIPHLGCTKDVCAAVRAGTRRAERVASLGVVNRRTGRAYLFDATPDFVSQVHTLTGGRPPDAIFLTHAHIGHYSGLMYLGRESIDAKGVPVYATEKMTTFLRGNGPWSQLAGRRNIELRPITPDRAVELDDGLRVTPFLVPHRDELSDTVGYLIESPAKKALFIPDIDQWQRWTRDIRELADNVDLAIVDGTFASADELPGRSMADVPHPLMPVTRELLRGTRAALWFIHVNHTNRELEARDVVGDGQRFAF